MRDHSDKKELALQLFNLEDANVLKIDCFHVGNDELIIDVTLVQSNEPCPICSCSSPKIKGYTLKKINHSLLTDRRCTIHYHARRYICPICKRTYYEHNPFVFQSQKISVLTIINVLKDLKDYNETFSSVAARHDISPTTVASIFDAHVSIDRKPLSEHICIDECYAFKSSDSKYVCMLLDFDTHKPIDILNSRRIDHLRSYLLAIDKSERENVKLVCSDMYDTYRTVSLSLFPNAVHIVDHYHLQADLNRSVDAVRIRVMRNVHRNNDSDSYYLLKHFNWLIYKSEETEEDIKKLKKKGKLPLFDPNRERKYNAHFKRHLNYYEIRDMLKDLHPDLRESWDLKDDVVDFYTSCTIDTAEAKLKELIKKFKSSEVKEMKDFGKTLYKWRNEIINSFHIVGYNYRVDSDTGHVVVQEKKMNNAIIENRNAILKCLKKNANGYSNWIRFRNRAMYVLDKDAKYSLYPLKRKEEK